MYIQERVGCAFQVLRRRKTRSTGDDQESRKINRIRHLPSHLVGIQYQYVVKFSCYFIHMFIFFIVFEQNLMTTVILKGSGNELHLHLYAVLIHNKIFNH